MRGMGWLAFGIASAVAVAASAAAPGAARPLRVVSYNVRKGTAAKRIAADLKPLKAHVIALQEVDRGTKRSSGEDQPELLKQALGMHGFYAPSYEVDGGTTGMMILSPLPLSGTGAVELKGARVIGATAVVTVKGAKLRVYSVHLSATYKLSADHAAAAQAAREREARHLAARVARERGAMILAGDLNTGPGSTAYQTLAARLTDAPAHLSRSPAATFPAWMPALRLDHVLVSRHLTPVGAATHRGASDHRLLVVDLDLSR